MKKTIHILGAGEWQVPTILKAKSLGFRVHVSDLYKDRPGYAYADTHSQIDITDLHATLIDAKKHNIDGIICDTTDAGVLTAAFVASKLALPGMDIQTAKNFTDKVQVGKLSQNIKQLSQPTFQLAHGIEDAKQAIKQIGLPCVIKPLNNQSSRGVQIIKKPEQVIAALNETMRHTNLANKILVESYINGCEYTVESYTVNDNTTTIGISQKVPFEHKPQVAVALKYTTEALPIALKEQLIHINANLIKAFGLRNGITHAEYKIHGNDIYLIEIAARGGGSRIYTDIVPHLAQQDIVKYYLEYAINNELPKLNPFMSKAAILHFLNISNEIFSRIEGLQAAKRINTIKEIHLDVQPNVKIHTVEDDRSRHGFILSLGNNISECNNAIREVNKTLAFIE